MSSGGERRVSLERSLQRTLGILVLGVLLTVSLAGAWIGRQAMEGFVASRLAHDAEAIVGAFDPATATVGRSLPPVYSQPLSGHYYVVQAVGYAPLRSRSLWDAELGTPLLAPGATATEVTEGPRGQTLLVWRAGYERQGQQLTVAVAEDIAPLLAALWRFLWAGVAAALAAAALLYWLQKRLLRRGFEPIDAVRGDVRRVSRGEADRLREEVPAEVLPLVTEFNSLIKAWQAHLQRSRNAVGNLAHALKSPLQVLLQHGRDRGDHTITSQAERMHQLVERELRQVRLAGTATAGARFEPARDVPDLVDSLNILYRHRRLDVDADIRAPGLMPFDQEDMLELLGNLLDNAAKWAERQVRVTVTNADGQLLRFVVEDDGEGVVPAEQGALLQRGIRLDESTPGHGLGLAIVRDIASLYGGRIAFGRSERLGGLSVTVELPVQVVRGGEESNNANRN